MTNEEMINRIETWCSNYSGGTQRNACAGCPLYEQTEHWCSYYENRENGEELLKKHYEILFGKSDSPVDHPSHYQGKHECIDEMIEMFGIDAVIGFCKCNVYKYRYRAERKNGEEDIRKAEWYMDKLIELNKQKGGEQMKNDLISRDDAVNAIRKRINERREKADHGFCASIREEDIEIIERLPSAEKIGKWIPTMKELHIGTVEGRMCSACNATYVGRAIHGNNFCTNCGARMEKEDER